MNSQQPQRVFISYRRSDCQPQANGLHDGLRHRLSNSKIFMDIDSIPAGVDFEEHIREEIEVCDVVLVLIGDNWLDPRPDSKVRRIDEDDDFVRLEIESALASKRVRIVPVLVEGAQMPRADELPQSIRRLSRFNAFELSDRRWTADVARLAQVLEEIQEAPTELTSAPTVTSANLQPQAATTAAPSMPTQGWSNAPVAFDPRKADRMPGSKERRTWVWMAILPLVSCGLAAFVPPLWVASQRKQDRVLQRRMWITAGAIGLSVLLGFILVGTAPTDSNDTPTGAASDIGAAFLFLAIIGGVTVAVLNRNAPPQLPGAAEEMARRQQREEYKRLLERDRALALSINVGRPDVHRQYDDGGLLDLNGLDAEALSTHGSLPREEAHQIVELRQRLGRLNGLEDVTAYTNLRESTVARLRERAVFL